MNNQIGIIEIYNFDWTEFVNTHHDENAGVIIHTPLYNRVVENHLTVLLGELIILADSTHERPLRTAAALMIKDVTENRHFQPALNGILPDLTVLLRYSAIQLMVNAAAIVEVEAAGIAFAAKLLHLALHSGEEWEEFTQLIKRVFYSPDSTRLLFMVLDVLCALPTELVARFVRLLEPSIRQSFAMFPRRMIQLLQEGTDHRPYFVLANVCGLYTEPQWSIMMEAAIMSSFFNTVTSSSRRILVASSLRICFDHYAYFFVSPRMVHKMRTIVRCLNTSGEPLEQRAAMELYEAFARRALGIPIPRD